MALGHVPVPVPHGDIRLGAQVAEAAELVIDQRLQGSDVNGPHGGGGILGKQGDDGEKGRLRLAGGSGGGEQQIVVGIEDRLRRRHLNGPQILPPAAVYKILHKRRVSVKSTHVDFLSFSLKRP